MTTAEIIKQMEKELYEFIASSPPNYPSVWKSLIRSRLRTLLESFGEEIIGRDRDEVIGNETYINTIIENQLRAEQRLKVKEIIKSSE